MKHTEIEKRNENRQMMEHRCETSAGTTAWKIVGGAVLALTAAAVIVSLPDIKRYIKISTM
ncbi:hypothetical protein BH20ACI4_BH20ACI4_03720 [soil metagenome]